jgi:hypothetical protein
MAAIERARYPRRWLERRHERRIADEWIALPQLASVLSRLEVS